jgi:hypothetical protein
MPSPAVLLCLILALAGQPLRQSESASDFARALTHAIDADGAIEIPDGGVGDDSGVATLRGGTSQVADPAEGQSCHRWAAADDLTSFTLTFPASDPGAPRRRLEQALGFPIGVRQRHAWLQLYLC